MAIDTEQIQELCDILSRYPNFNTLRTDLNKVMTTMASTTENGLMTTAHVAKLDNISNIVDAAIDDLNNKITSGDAASATLANTMIATIELSDASETADGVSVSEKKYTNTYTLKLLRGNGEVASTIDIPDIFYRYSNATESKAGLISAEDQAKLNNISPGANAYELPVAGKNLGGVKTTSAITDTAGLIPVPIIDGIPYYKDTTYGIATDTVAGLIKSGTDITVDSSGNVSVNDNSHKHTVSNISDFPTSMPASDVYDWAKASTKPTYTASEVGADPSGSANAALSSAKSYTDTKIDALIDGAPETMDTLKELNDAIANNKSVLDAINASITTKANTSDLNSHLNDKDNPHAVTKAQVGLSNVDNTADNTKNVLSATKWTTARTISLTGAITGSVNIDGSDNVTMETAEGATSFRTRFTIIDGTTDWNTVTSAGMYTVRITTWGDASILHSPNSAISTLYKWGLLLVFKSGSQSTALTQIYIPHSSKDGFDSTAVMRQTYIGTDGGWQAWRPIYYGIDKSYIGLDNVENKSSATIRGELTKNNVTTALGYTPPSSVSFNQSLTSGTKIGTLNISGSDVDLYTVTNKLVVGASDTASNNAAATNGNVYLNFLDNSTIKNAHRVIGAGGVTVTSDANGHITITGTTYSSVKNPYALTYQFNGVTQDSYDGSSAKTLNITPTTIGAADSVHDHRRIKGKFGERQTSVNIESSTDSFNTLEYFQVTTNMTGSPMWHGHILHMNWDTQGWDSQLFIPNFDTDDKSMQFRGMKGGTWRDWKTLLDSSNYTSYTVTKTGSGASGNWGINITGNAATATKATKDSADQQITTTYIKGLSVSGKVITYTKGDGSTGTITTQDTNTTYSVMTGATASTAGTSGLVPAPATGKNTAFLRGDGTWVVPTDNKVTNTLATTTKAYITGTTSNTTNTGTQVFDTGVYLDTTAGRLTATSFNENGTLLADKYRIWRRAVVGQNANCTTNPYYKFASIVLSTHNEDRSITFKVSTGYNDKTTTVGILTAHVRTNGNAYWDSGELIWEYANSGIDTSKFIYAHNTNTNPIVVELWACVDTMWRTYKFDVISECSRISSLNESWTLYNTVTNTTTGNASAVTSGYTTFTSTLGTLLNPTTGNATSATKATNDSSGQQINTTYIKGLSVSGQTITYTKGNGSTGTITTQDTKYSAGTGLSLSGTTFNHKNSVTAGTAQGDANKTLTFGGTFTIPTVSYDAQGHVTGKGTTTMTMPANPNTDTKVTNTVNNTAKAYLTGTTNSATNTGTQVFDTGVYLTTTAGQMNATTYKVAEKVTMQYNSTEECLNFVFS